MSDCEKMVNLVNNREVTTDEMINVTLDCRALLERNPTFQLQFQGRNANTLADWLAREARLCNVSSHCIQWIHSPPMSCINLYNSELVPVAEFSREVGSSSVNYDPP